ncbi:Nin one binding Zn-ribbon like-domain-containing protein [Haematococcus lacustris]
MNWAALVKASPAVEEVAAAPAAPEAGVPGVQRQAVVDANAIISGLSLRHLADRFVTIQEVLNEVRDKQSRQFLASLPFGLAVAEPSEESLRAVTVFARETGDAHALSATDLKLLALAHTLETRVNTTSTVLSVTGDFAMQNVLLQMGLRLVTRDGRQISRLSRWALRCSACFFVTKEAGRLFCPRCGNMALERVEVVVGAGGAEFFGVRKNHTLRGTRFSLPKPKGGRAKNPILCEDELLARIKQRKQRPGRAVDAALNSFTPEFGSDTWHKAHAASQAALVTDKGWKNNPNERKNVASNRRRK